VDPADRDRVTGDTRIIRVGFSGCGIVSELHAQAIASNPRTELAAVFDPDRDRAEAAAARWQCRTHAAYADLLGDAEVDAVFVLSPTPHHLEQARAALEAGKDVLVEKPVALDSADAEQLVRDAADSGRVCMPGHNYAYIPEFRRVRDVVRSGELGEVRYVAISYSIAHTEEVASRYDGVLQVVMPHHAYLATGLLGEPAAVFAGRTEPGWTSLARDDQCWMVLEYPPRATALLFASMAVDDGSPGAWTFLVKAVGTQGSIAGSWDVAALSDAAGGRRLRLYEESFRHELAAFVAAVDGVPDAIVSPLADAASVGRVLTAAGAAIEQRGAAALA
jgi:predicted dehydrogenase